MILISWKGLKTLLARTVQCTRHLTASILNIIKLLSGGVWTKIYATIS